MKINWRSVAHIGAAIVGTVIPGVAEAEQLAESLPGLRGREKEDRVVQLVKTALVAEQGFTGKALAQDADVEAMTRGVIAAVIGLHSTIAAKAAASKV